MTDRATYRAAMINGFADELEKIAGVGALIGGGAGYMLSPNSLKGKAIGILGGAAVGHALGATAKAGKRAFHDELRDREHRTLYGYTPSGAMDPDQPANW